MIFFGIVMAVVLDISVKIFLYLSSRQPNMSSFMPSLLDLAVGWSGMVCAEIIQTFLAAGHCFMAIKWR